MRTGLAWLAGALGLAALWRYLRRPEPSSPPTSDPAAELRARLDEARGAGDDRDEFDAAEGQPLEEAHAPEQAPSPRSLEERRRAIHEKAERALGEMRDPGE